MPRASRVCAVVVAMLVLAVVMVGAAHAVPVTVDGTFLSFTSSLFDSPPRPHFVNGIALTPTTSTTTDPNSGSTQFLSSTVNFTPPTTVIAFHWELPVSGQPTIIGTMNSLEFIAAPPQDVGFGEIFQLGTFRVTNGQYPYQADMRMRLTTSSTSAELGGQTFEATLRYLSNQDLTLPFDPYQEADFFFWLERPDLGSGRVFDLFRQPPGNPGNVASFALYGRIGSLIPTGFVALDSAGFTNPSVQPGPLPPGAPVPAPGTLALLGTALTVLPFIRRLRR